MSRKGNCWDNAVMERVWPRDHANHAEATSDIADCIVAALNLVLTVKYFDDMGFPRLT